jgi:hypothetical protein
MQAYTKHCKDYYVGKRITNEMCGINHKSKFLLDHPNDTNSLTPNAPYYNNDEYFGDDLNDNCEFDFDNDMENPDLSQYIYGDFNAILYLVVVVKNLIISFQHVVHIIFGHMDPTMFQGKMKDLHDALCVNSILQHFLMHLLNLICIQS